MGLAIRDILNSEYCKDFKVLAGHSGIDKEIQGIATLDAPDGYKWTRGRELVLSSGYIFKENPDLFEKYLEDDQFRKISGMAIKFDRYLGEIDSSILGKFDEHNIPLIHVPNGPSWMDIMNILNVLVMNKQIKQFRIEGINTRSLSDVSYQNRKINKILYKIEKEMEFPAMLYDVQNDKPYYSSRKFKKISDELSFRDFWNPSFKYTKETLCDNLNITRFRFRAKRYKAPFSWITIPIIVDNDIKAYLVFLEAEGLIDYFDQFAIRIAFLLIQSLYEQRLVSLVLRDSGFKKFIEDIVNRSLTDKDLIIERAEDLYLDTRDEYLVVTAKNKNLKDFIRNETIESSFKNIFEALGGRISPTSGSSYLFLIPLDKNIGERENINKVKDLIIKFNNDLKTHIPGLNLKFGISDIPSPIENIYTNYDRSLRALEVGDVLYGDLYYITYSELGPLAWLDIKPDEVDRMKNILKELLDEENSQELIETLEAYLESNMNYSLAAKKLFVHINTVRNRIESINNLLGIDLEDPINRLKLEIMIKVILNKNI